MWPSHCPYCNVELDGLYGHVGPYMCGTCGKEFKTEVRIVLEEDGEVLPSEREQAMRQAFCNLDKFFEKQIRISRKLSEFTSAAVWEAALSQLRLEWERVDD